MKKLKILVIEGYQPNRIALTEALKKLGHNAMSAADEKIPLMAKRENNFDIIIADENFFAIGGFLSGLRGIHPKSMIVMMFNGFKGGEDKILGGGSQPDAKVSNFIKDHEKFSDFLAELCELPS